MVKSLARRALSAEHQRYLSWSSSHFGLLPTMVGLAGMWRSKGLARARNPITGGTINLRPGTVDQVVYDEVFERLEFDLPLGSPRVIVDAGAHIGLASVYFASCHPNATVIAIEPEPENFQILCRNAEAWPNIHPVNAALWSGATKLGIDNEGVESWGYQVSEKGVRQNIQAIGIPELKKLFRLDHIDVLKLDIEGSEVEVFRNSDEWLPAVGNMIVELHDRFRPGCTAALEKALLGYQFQREFSREKAVITEIAPHASPPAEAAKIPWVNCNRLELAAA